MAAVKVRPTDKRQLPRTQLTCQRAVIQKPFGLITVNRTDGRLAPEPAVATTL